MLDHLKKKFGLADTKVEASAETATVVSELTAALEQSEASVATLTAQLAEAMEKLASVDEILAKAEADKQALVEAAEKARTEARMSAIVYAVGTAKADALFSATKSLGDEEFNAIVSAMQGTLEVEAESALFTEVGATAEVDVANVKEKSALEKALEEKYSASK